MLSRSSLNYIWHFWGKSVGVLIKNSSVKRESLWTLSLECSWNEYRKSQRCTNATLAISKNHYFFKCFWSTHQPKSYKLSTGLLNCHKIIYYESEGYKILIFFFFYSCKTVKLNKGSDTPIFCVSWLPSYCLIILVRGGLEAFQLQFWAEFYIIRSQTLPNLYLIW